MGFTSIMYGQFSQGQLACPHCEKNKMDKEFLKHLKLIENKCSFDFDISSGYRCEVHNREIPGAHEESDHMYGLAVDIRISGQQQIRELENYAEESGYFMSFLAYDYYVHIGRSSRFGWRSEPPVFVSSTLTNTVFGGIGIKYTMIEGKSTPLPSLRLGYFLPDEEYDENLFYFMDIVSDKLINNNTNDVAQNQIAFGAGWSSFVDPNYFGLNLSTGLGFLKSLEPTDKQENVTYYFAEPSINFGFLFQYIDWQINLGYTFTKGVKLGTLDDNNVGGFYFEVVASIGSFWN
tara:strand:- start:101 stop:973 length:873 start_codon:yes stop_codon:yes gene_type:complete